jgi:hypothetical protein
MAYEKENKRIPELGMGAFYWLIAVGSSATTFGVLFDFLPAKLMGFPTLGLLLSLPCVTKSYWI